MDVPFLGSHQIVEQLFQSAKLSNELDNDFGLIGLWADVSRMLTCSSGVILVSAQTSQLLGRLKFVSELFL